LPILHVETNFLIAIATGRDRRASEVITSPPEGFRLAIPGICYFEASDWMEDERKRTNGFLGDLKNHINELDRDLSSTHAKLLRAHLSAAILEKKELLAETNNRLGQAVQDLSALGEMIGLTSGILESARTNPLIGQLTDNLILHTILEHARTDPDPIKAFLTENHNDFGSREAQEAIRLAGISYFRKTESFLEWASTRSSPAGP
jgi:hypothetical protein